MSTYPRPPAVPGLPEIRPADLWRSMWWIERGFILEMRRGPRRAYAAAGALLGVLMPELLIFAVGAVTPHRRGTRYYISPSRDAVLTVRAARAARDGWHVENHVSAHPGTERGRALRELVAPSLQRAADAAGVAILVGAANIKLATIYKEQFEELVDVGTGSLGHHNLRRAPPH